MLVKLFLLYFTTFIICKSIWANIPCSPGACKKSDEISSCNIQPSIPAAHCLNHERTIISKEDKMSLLDKINNRRNKIASGDVKSFPSAENMNKLEWNEDLEVSAQRWADQCISQGGTQDRLDMCRDFDNKSVGQNIATVYGEAPSLSPLSLVDVWYMELLNTNASILFQYATSRQRNLLHYDYFTQLIWARTKEVGCGAVKFKELLEDGKRNRTVNRLVCNFLPSGNVLGEGIYTAGPPCTKCPTGRMCDVDYKALCKIIKIASEMKEQNEDYLIKLTNNTGIDKTYQMPKKNLTFNIDNINDDDNLPFDYISQFFDYTEQSATYSSTQSSSLCRDVIVVEDFVELLKKKLSNDPSFKEMLLSTKASMRNENADVTNTDPNVALFVSKVYSKILPPTTTKLPESDYVNSTLLADLVEAVIFRSGDRTIVPQVNIETRPSVGEVMPVKIQAELAEIKPNYDFTGHYFFPEDFADETTTESTESYDDSSNIVVSDVVLEIEHLRKEKTTRHFLEDIIDSDIAVESTTNIKKRRRKRNTTSEEYESLLKPEINCPSCDKNSGDVLVKYSDLLVKLSKDLKQLKLNEIYSCYHNCAFMTHRYNHLVFTVLTVLKINDCYI